MSVSDVGRAVSHRCSLAHGFCPEISYVQYWYADRAQALLGTRQPHIVARTRAQPRGPENGVDLLGFVALDNSKVL